MFLGPDSALARTGSHRLVLDTSTESLLSVGKEYHDGLPFPMLHFDSQSIRIRQTHIRHEGGRPIRVPCGSKSFGEDLEDGDAGRLVSFAGVAGNEADLAGITHRHCVGEELAMLVQHVLGKGQRLVQESVQIVLGSLTG